MNQAILKSQTDTIWIADFQGSNFGKVPELRLGESTKTFKNRSELKILGQSQCLLDNEHPRVKMGQIGHGLKQRVEYM